jgi:FtsH-binding integral membrane protein
MRDLLPDASLDPIGHRALLLGLAAIAFTALLGLVALPGKLEDRQVPIWFTFWSFCALVAALNLQGYKARRWQDLLADALMESAILALLASVLAYILASDLAADFKLVCLVLGAIVWSVDFLARVHFAVADLRGKEVRDGISQGS